MFNCTLTSYTTKSLRPGTGPYFITIRYTIEIQPGTGLVGATGRNSVVCTTRYRLILQSAIRCLHTVPICLRHCFYVSQTLTPRPTHSELFLPFSLQLRKRRKRSTLKQQLFAEHHSHPLLCQSMESWVEKQTFLSNILLRNLLISGKSQTVRYWDG